MKKLYPTFTLLFLFISYTSFSQVGVGTTNPQSTLDVEASNSSNPSNSDGILIPRVANFPVSNPTAAQDGMLLFYTGTTRSGKGFYYWNQSISDWVFLAAGAKNTLDEAYDEGGAGAGRTIIADNGAVNIQGNDGLRVEGTIVVGERIEHDGDTDTFIDFTTDRIEMDAGGISYMDIQQANQEIAFNEDGEVINFRIEGDTNQNLLFVDGTNDRIGIGTNAPNNPFHIRMNTPFDLDHANTGQDDIFMAGGGANAIDNVAASIAFGGNNNRENLRRAAIASVQSGNDVDFSGLAFYVHGNPQTLSPMVERMRLSHQGFLGINNTSPSATLDVVGSMQYEDGNEAAGFVLSSDATGNASWTDPSIIFTDTNTTYDGTDFALSNQSLAAGQFVIGVDATGNLIGGTDQDSQTLNLIGTTLSISNANNVDLSSLSDNDWITVGANIERQSGDVYIGDTSGTDNNLYISNRIIDWDDNSYIIDPNDESFMNKVNFDAGSSTEPSITFDNDTSTGFYRYGVNGIGFTSNGTSFIRFSPRGQIEFFNTGNSIYLGQSAGNSDDFTDNRNIGIGRAVLTNNTTGDFNVGVGYLTLQSNTSGQRNVAVGHGVMPFNTTGGNNVAFGSGALYYNFDGDNNISLGTNSLRDNISGDSNIGIGSGALLNNEASYNIGIGTSAGIQITTGTANIGIGRSAQGSNQEGNDNIAIGSQSMLYTNHATNANSNVALGTLAMAAVDEGSNNIAIGNAALFGSYDAANNNVAIGHQAGQGVEGNNNIYIGYQAGYNDGASSNHLYIESSNADETAALIYGEFDNDILRFNGNVGIGRAPSTNALEVEGEASKTTPGAFVANSDQRLKTNIETISSKTALEKLLSLRGVSYEWNDTQTNIKRPEGVQYGFIAQELMEIFPEKVTKDNLGFYQTAYGDYDPFFVQAIKELHHKVETLEAKNAELQKKLDLMESLEARILALEKEN